MIRFRKMHGLGNDFVILDARAATEEGADLPPGSTERRQKPVGTASERFGITPRVAAAIADRHFGVGCDQLIVLEPGEGSADVFMRIFNPDGSAAGACGNATRCVASLVMDELGRDACTVRTISGDLPSTRDAQGIVTVDMGMAQLRWRDVPLAEKADTLNLPIEQDGVSNPAACSMGNPHATFFVEDLDKVDVPAVGPGLERHPLFPERANVGFVQVLSPEHIRLEVWERGAGRTLACGSGACAALVNAHRRGFTGRSAKVSLPGGDLTITWREDRHVLMTGPVATAFTGEIDLAALIG